MNWTERQTPINISGNYFPAFQTAAGKPPERFWFVKDEFVRHSQSLLAEGGLFSHIGATRVDSRWVCAYEPVARKDIASLVWTMRLFYLESEPMSICSVCAYMEENVENTHVRLFFKHMRQSWKESLRQPVPLLKDYQGVIQNNKQLIDALLYSGNFHSQEKAQKRYGELLEYMDESLILMSAYNAMLAGF